MPSPASRRQFLKAASAGAAMAFTATSYAKIVGANERISLGLIGCGGRGYEAHMTGVHPYDKEQNVEFTAVSDPWKQRRERAAARAQQWYGRPARQFASYQDIVALKDVDAVMIASCDHQHCLHLEAAIKAKLDAYVEKPLDEGFTCPDHCEATWVYPEGFLVHYVAVHSVTVDIGVEWSRRKGVDRSACRFPPRPREFDKK